MSSSSSDRRKDVEKNILCCLVTQKGSVTISQLNNLYKEFEGENIPYREFNYSTLFEYLESLTNVLKIRTSGSEVKITSIPSEKSQHVRSLVAGQRPAKIRSKSRYSQKSAGHSNHHNQHRYREDNFPRSNSRRESRRESHTQQSYVASLESDNSLKPSNNRTLENSAAMSRHGNNVNPRQTRRNENNGFNSNYNAYAAESKTHHDNASYIASSSREENNHDVNHNSQYNGSNKSESRLIDQRTKDRLRALIESHPDGIWCAELPQKFSNQFSVELRYSNFGFDSVREFTSKLPEIFHCATLTESGDYKLFDARKPLPNIEKVKRHSQPSELLNQNCDNESSGLPNKLAPSTVEKLMPEDVMDATESVGHINVAELFKMDYETVQLCELFSPTIFWVHLRERVPEFNKFMSELHAFYEEEKKKYRIPAFMLEVNLNVACLYYDKWHRGIIKSIDKNNNPVVHFYDYGTVKSYHAEDLYFLHRRFAYLPAQAILCGLYNVKPCNSNEWNMSSSYEFKSKTWKIPLMATMGSMNKEENSLLICLTDTRREEDFHINDWMCEKNYGTRGRLHRTKNRNFAFRHYMECLVQRRNDSSDICTPGSSNVNTEKPLLKCKFNSTELNQSVKSNDESEKQLRRIQEIRDKLRKKNTADNVSRSSNSIQSPSSSKSTNISESLDTTSSYRSKKIPKHLQELVNKCSIQHSTPNCSKNINAVPSDNIQTNPKIQDISTVKTASPVESETTDSDSFPIYSPMMLKKDLNEKKEIQFFGSIRSECGGSGHMLPINWKELRASVQPESPSTSTESPKETTTDKPPTSNQLNSTQKNLDDSRKKINIPEKKLDSSSKQPETSSKLAADSPKFLNTSKKPTEVSSTVSTQNLPLAKIQMIRVMNNDPNSTFYEQNVKFLPSGNVKPAVTNISPLLKLKQRLNANSSKSVSILVSPKMIKLLKGELDDTCKENSANFSQKPITVAENSYNEEVMDIKKKVENWERKNDVNQRTVELIEKKVDDDETIIKSMSQSISSNSTNSKSRGDNVSRLTEDSTPKSLQIKENLTKASIVKERFPAIKNNKRIPRSDDSHSLDSDDLSESDTSDEVPDCEIPNQELQTNTFVFNDKDISSNASNTDTISSEEVKLFMSQNFKSIKSISSSDSSSERGTKKNDFDQSASETVSPAQLYEPPGRSKTLRNLLMSMKQQR